MVPSPTIVLMVCCRLCELNVTQQVFNVCSNPIVQTAWDAGKPLTVHGLVYSLKDGLLKVCHDLCNQGDNWKSLIK